MNNFNELLFQYQNGFLGPNLKYLVNYTFLQQNKNIPPELL